MWTNSRDIALVFLSLQAMVLALVPLALLGGLAYAVHRFRAIVRRYLRLGFSYSELVRKRVESGAHKAALPLMRINGSVCMTRTIAGQLIPKHPRCR